MICILKFTDGHKSVQKGGKVELWFLFCAYHLIMLYICIKFCQNISKRSMLSINGESKITISLSHTINDFVAIFEAPDKRFKKEEHALKTDKRASDVEQYGSILME